MKKISLFKRLFSFDGTSNEKHVMVINSLTYEKEEIPKKLASLEHLKPI
ncbi:MAG: hypothetical protein SNJ77_09090 [Cytophagales bacterium]